MEAETPVPPGATGTGTTGSAAGGAAGGAAGAGCPGREPLPPWDGEWWGEEDSIEVLSEADEWEDRRSDGEGGRLEDMFEDLSMHLIRHYVDLARHVPSSSRLSSSCPPSANLAFQALPRVEMATCSLSRPCDFQCAICLEEWSGDDVAARIPCGHLFHEACLESWLRRSFQCPACRYELPADEPECNSPCSVAARVAHTPPPSRAEQGAGTPTHETDDARVRLRK
eukprot:CAMPEP_0171216820 /NCGR_PEP_ID=MMETSP0790-20130122/32373_1 /TAXON_ID=2925 /ORGANISM="Alexandrium catenella, Strain OF101" /LENGTH=225 /DNA_ID=CAMNT_0011682603 /DNA_START=45 /DNA_END=720 /DNA_ORIENTATION=-